MKKLNLGCEKEYRQGWVNLDFDKNQKSDIYWDLNKFPYPFKNEEFDEILASGILEHIDNFYKAMMELWRIGKHKGRIYVYLPHASDITTTWGEVEHKRAFSYHTFGSAWCNKELYPYFRILKKKIVFSRVNFTFINKIVDPIINLIPQFWERMLSGILPCGCLVYILEIRKDKEFIENRRRIIENFKSVDNYKFIREA